MAHKEVKVICAECGGSYCEVCHPKRCPHCGSPHIEEKSGCRW